MSCGRESRIAGSSQTTNTVLYVMYGARPTLEHVDPEKPDRNPMRRPMQRIAVRSIGRTSTDTPLSYLFPQQSDLILIEQLPRKTVHVEGFGIEFDGHPTAGPDGLALGAIQGEESGQIGVRRVQDDDATNLAFAVSGAWVSATVGATDSATIMMNPIRVVRLASANAQHCHIGAIIQRDRRSADRVRRSLRGFDPRWSSDNEMKRMPIPVPPKKTACSFPGKRL